MATNGLSLPSHSGGQNGMPAASVTVQEMDALAREVRSASLYNRQLSSICQVNGLKSTGVKAELQRRIIDLITETYHAQDSARFQQVRQSIHYAKDKSPQKPAPGRSNPPPNGMPAYNGIGYGGGGGYGHHSAPHHSPSMAGGMPSSYPHLTFHWSPFYDIEAQITPTQECQPMPNHRHTINVSLRLIDKPLIQRCVDDTSYRVMIFCAGPDTSGTQHIAFPPQTEIKVNGGEVKANTRGLKNKPGSTRPVDITSALRLKSNYLNNVDFTFALTKHKYHFALKLCKISTVEQLVQKAKMRHRISQELVIAEINKKNSDPDIEATSSVLDLRCPITYMRLSIPVRGTKCTHIQCFDLTSYLQLQEQGPQWSCPVCSKSAPFDQLAVDEYVKDILCKTSQNTEKITIHTDGQWSIARADDDNSNSNSNQRSQPANVAAMTLDDDEIEISGVSEIRPKRETPQEPTPIQNITPARPSSSTANGPRGLGSTSAKRPAAAVIDLTLSDSDDEPVVRPNKRQNTNGFQSSSRPDPGFLDD